MPSSHKRAMGLKYRHPLLTYTSIHLSCSPMITILIWVSILSLAQAISLGWGTSNKLQLPTLGLGRQANQCQVNIGGKVAVGQIVEGGCRYTVRYGDAGRWAAATSSTSFGLVTIPSLGMLKTDNGFSNMTTGLPPSCPQLQGYDTGSTQSEDCLYATVYTPLTVSPTASLPVLTWSVRLVV
jgi:hypothetical protein